MFNFLRALGGIPVKLWLHLGVTTGDKRDMIKHTLTSAHYVQSRANDGLLEWINHSEERKKFSSERLAYYIESLLGERTVCVLQRMSIFICIIKTTWKERELEFEGRQIYWTADSDGKKAAFGNGRVSWKLFQICLLFDTNSMKWKKLHCVCHFNKIKQPKTMKMHRNTREKFNELNLIYFSGERTPARVPRLDLIAECKTHQISIFVACAVVEI